MKLLIFIFLPLQAILGNLSLWSSTESQDSAKKLKVLHLTFHQGCAIEIERVAQALSLELTTWFIHRLPTQFFDGETKDNNALYNIGHDRANKIWSLHNEFFNSFDVILTSDTAPLSRIFLQNGWKKPLIIWVCNRFDYSHQPADCNFPDQEYYDLFKKACQQDNVKIVAYTGYEHVYMADKGLKTGSLLIKPVGFVGDPLQTSSIPNTIDKKETFFLPPYHNETIFMNMEAHCKRLGIQAFCGRYNGVQDLMGFKGIIHLPYSWSNLALFENLQLGVAYFIPSAKFLRELYVSGDYFIPNMNEHFYSVSEWYCQENAPCFIYFDSWDDLVYKVTHTDFEHQKVVIKNHIQNHRTNTLNQWKMLFH